MGVAYHASGFFVACLIRKAVAPVVAVPIITKRGITWKENDENEMINETINPQSYIKYI